MFYFYRSWFRYESLIIVSFAYCVLWLIACFRYWFSYLSSSSSLVWVVGDWEEVSGSWGCCCIILIKVATVCSSKSILWLAASISEAKFWTFSSLGLIYPPFIELQLLSSILTALLGVLVKSIFSLSPILFLFSRTPLFLSCYFLSTNLILVGSRVVDAHCLFLYATTSFIGDITEISAPSSLDNCIESST